MGFRLVLVVEDDKHDMATRAHLIRDVTGLGGKPQPQALTESGAWVAIREGDEYKNIPSFDISLLSTWYPNAETRKFD